MHEHSAARRGIEPPQVKHRLRFAGSEEIPFPVCPGLYPCMVVISMCPTWCIHLPCRYGDRPESCHKQRRLLSTAAIGSLDCSKRRACPRIRRLVDSFLMAPVVDFKNGVFHGQVLNPRCKLTEEDCPCSIKILIVDPHRKDKMPEFTLRDCPAPRHLFHCLLCEAIILKIIIYRLIKHITQRHIRIQEFHSFLLSTRQRHL